MNSEIRPLGEVSFPEFSGLRIMMMPFKCDDLLSLPDFTRQYAPIIKPLLARVEHRNGVGYLTVDEALVKAGEFHRRPGLHVDGGGAWGGGAPWASRGMIVAASHRGSIGWNQEFTEWPGYDGDCEHLKDQLRQASSIPFEANCAYWCGPYAVHCSEPLLESAARQFLRISMPSEAPWFEGYTANPLGILPVGPILPRRTQMDYRP